MVYRTQLKRNKLGRLALECLSILILIGVIAYVPDGIGQNHQDALIEKAPSVLGFHQNLREVLQEGDWVALEMFDDRGAEVVYKAYKNNAQLIGYVRLALQNGSSPLQSRKAQIVGLDVEDPWKGIKVVVF